MDQKANCDTCEFALPKPSADHKKPEDLIWPDDFSNCLFNCEFWPDEGYLCPDFMHAGKNINQ